MELSEVNKLTVAAYKKTAQKYHDSFYNEMSYKAYDRLILDRFSESINNSGLICDAGCGPSGQIGKYLYQKGFRIIGIDISPFCIEIAKEYQPEMEFDVVDMMHTPFEESKFDGIISFYSIIHTPKKDINKIIREFKRILKNNGKLLIVVKKGENEGIVKDDWYEGHEIYFTHFLEEELEGYLRQNQFELNYLDTRAPEGNEINVDRIYIIGTNRKRA